MMLALSANALGTGELQLKYSLISDNHMVSPWEVGFSVREGFYRDISYMSYTMVDSQHWQTDQYLMYEIVPFIDLGIGPYYNKNYQPDSKEIGVRATGVIRLW